LKGTKRRGSTFKVGGKQAVIPNQLRENNWPKRSKEQKRRTTDSKHKRNFVKRKETPGRGGGGKWVEGTS